MIGSLFSGYGGLDMAVEDVFGEQPAWFVEYDDAPSKILAHHWPDVPNYGDVTTLDWSAVPPVTIITAGYPCQPFSQAGKRKGSDDERHLWPYVLEAVRHLRPRFVVLENVRGHLTLGFDRVLADLAQAGYDAEWICLRASDAGAPHRRERIFILAQDTNGEPWDQRRESAPGQAQGGRSWTDAGRRGGASSADSERERGERRRGADDLAGAARDRAREEDQREWHGDAVEHRRATAPDATGARRGGRQGLLETWGAYAPAIERWEQVTGRIAPAATVHGRLAPRFVEWMMGLPEGWVDTDLARAKQLKALGNGVVPQQAALALSILLGSTSHHLRQGDTE